MTVGNKSTFRQVSVQAGPGCAARGTWSTPSFTCKPPAAKPLTVDSARCPRTTRPANRSATPLPAGVSAACGCPAAPSGARQGGQANQAQRGHHRLPIGQDRLKRGQRGYDAGKRVKGRRRHIASDTMGLLLAVVVHSAGIQDRAGAKALLIRLFLRFECLKAIFAMAATQAA